MGYSNRERVRRKDLSLTERVIDSVRFHYNKLRFPTNKHIINSKDLQLVTEGFVSILAKDTPFDPDGTLSLLSYVAPRIPKEIFSSDTNVTLSFNSDPHYFVGEKGPKEGIETAKSRSRWYKVEHIEDGGHHTHITMHAQSQLAIIETLTHLSIIERLREKIHEILKKSVLTPNETQFIWNTLEHLTPSSNPHRKGERHINIWADKTINVISNDSMAPWDELKSSHVTGNEKYAPTAKLLAEHAETFLNTGKKKQPSVLMFSNSYSLPNILSHYLLNRETQGKKVREHFIEKATTAWRNKSDKTDILNKSKLEALGESIACIQKGLSEDQRNFIIDNMIIFDFTKGNESFDDEIISGFIKDFKDEGRLKKDLGIETIIEGKCSPTADSLHYIDFNKVKDEVLEGLNPLVRDTVSKLKQEEISALYLPYAPGDLTFSIILEMKRHIHSIGMIAEVGKVAHYIGGVDQRKINGVGQLVVPVKTLPTWGDKKIQHMNNIVKPEHLQRFESIRPVSETHLLQAPTVVLQDPMEMKDIVKGCYGEDTHKQDISINMEGHFINLGAKVFDIPIAEADYLSDVAIDPQLLMEFARLGRDTFIKQITKTMGRKGVFGVHAATAGVLCAIAGV